MKERFLPIGSVVLLKEGKKEVMITSYCVFPAGVEVKNKELVQPEPKMYDYGGCAYPEGIVQSDIVLAFNHEQIDKVLFTGYETDAQKKLSGVLNASYDKILEELKKSL